MITGTAKERMLSYLNKDFYENSRIMKSILQSQGNEIDNLRITLDEILWQFFIPAATWGLRDWEEHYGLPVNEGLDLETRRNQVLAKKRRGRRNLTNVLRAVEPTISLAWGRLIMPFTIQTEIDDYDFGSLIVLLEKRKPSHTGYTLRIKPELADSGYTVYANHMNRGLVNLNLRAGSVRTGRYPRWNSPGDSQTKILGIKDEPITGDGFFDLAAHLYSGPVIDKSNSAIILRGTVGVTEDLIVATSNFTKSGTKKVGTFPVVANIGSLISSTATIGSADITGLGYQFPCGPAYCGEEVA